MAVVSLVVFITTIYVLVFRILAENLGYRPPALPVHLLLNPKSEKNDDTNHRQDNLLTIFLVDGLRADVLEEELEAGHLPALQRLADGGCRVRNVMAAFPSITGYAYWPLLTGMDATRSGHLGTRYFDRRRRRQNIVGAEESLWPRGCPI